MSVVPQSHPGARQQSVNYPAPNNEYDHSAQPQARNSTRSSTRGSERREGSTRSGTGHVPAVQTAVTRLLVATKQLLESLTQWSKGEVNENDVSDVYVRMGNDFNSAVAAFQGCGIDMSDLMSVPDDLRAVLELALAEEATQENLEIYLPDVRAIIKNLLQGLRVKQHDYKVNRSDTPHSGHERSDSVARSERSTVSRASTQQGSQRSNTFRPDPGMPMPVPAPANPGEQWVGGFATPPPPGPGAHPQPQFGGDYQPPAQPPNRNSSRSSTTSAPQPPFGKSPQAFVHQPVHEETEDESSRKQSVQRRPPGHAKSLSRASGSNAAPPSNETPSRITSMAPQLPPLSPDVKRYSLADNPILRAPSPPPNPPQDHASQISQHGRSPGGTSSQPLPPHPNVFLETATPTPSAEPAQPAQAQPTIGRPMSPSPPPDTPTSDGGQTELNDKALSALKSRDALSRRASKRFSTYTFNKMTSSPSAPSTAPSGNQLKNRRSMVPGGALLSTGDLNALSEVDEAPSPNKAQRARTLDAGRRGGMGGDSSAPPVPPLPSTVSRFLPSTVEESAEDVDRDAKPTETKPETAPTPKATAQQAPPSRSPAPSNQPFTVFLQLESQVRKAKFEPGMTIAALRILFVEKFAYNPGLDNFPDIYIRDPTSQVMYELEDINEVKEKSLLSLNIEPLGQIKQHIDNQMTSLSQDLRELKSSVASMKRMSVQPALGPPSLPSAAPGPDSPARPSERQFQTLARRLSKIRTNDGSGLSPPQLQQLQPQQTGTSLVSQATGTSNLTMMSDAASVRIVSDLKTQFDEIVLLRRDLGVMRQMYVDFVNQTKASIGNMRTQAQTVRQLAGTKVSGDRAYVVAGREKLDSRTTTLLTRLEELQDSVENLRHDVVKRHVTPRPAAMKMLKETIASTATELHGIKEYIETVQPMWKQTWARELAGIVEEQEFLRHISEFVGDLATDHAEAEKIFEDINGVVSIRPSAPTPRAGGRSFRPPPPDEGHQGITSVLSQIRVAAVDPEQRMRAIEASQRQRKMDLAGRSDAFQAELSGYVQGKKLKMTGGAEEAERMRQKRNDVTLKAMFGVNGAGGGSTGGQSPQPSPSRSTASGPSPAIPPGQLPSEGGA